MAVADVFRPLAPALPHIRKWGPRVIGAALLVASLVLLWREFRDLDVADLTARIRAWGRVRIGEALALCAASFILRGVVEWMGLRWSGARLPVRTAMVRSFIVNGIAHSLGSSVVVAALARNWAYGRNGLKLAPSAMTSVFQAVSFTGGLALMVGTGLILASDQQLGGVRLPGMDGKVFALVLLGAVAVYVVACAVWPKRWRLFDTPAPSAPMAMGQVLLGAIDNALAGAILWVLAAPDPLPFQTFVFAYGMAAATAALSHVPAGLGVFEATSAVLLPQASHAALAAGFIGFRLIFFVLPLIGAVTLALLETPARRVFNRSQAAAGAGDRRL